MNPCAQLVLITGASAGIGQALAVGLAREGLRVIAVGRQTAGLAATAQAAQGVAGWVEPHRLDVTDGPAVEALWRDIAHRHGPVDLLVNGAAVHPRAPLRDTDPADWAQGVAINLNGVVHGCRAAVRVWDAQRPAVILNAGSFAHLGLVPGTTLYCATKAAVSAFSRALAAELTAAGSALVVNEWVPGMYRTRIGSPQGDDPAQALPRLHAVWQASQGRPGGRLFLEDREQHPPEPLRQRLRRHLRALVGR